MSFSPRSALLGSAFLLSVAAAPAAHASLTVLGDTNLNSYDSLDLTQKITGLSESDTKVFTVSTTTALTDISVNTGSNIKSYSYVLKNSAGAIVGSFSATSHGTDILSDIAYTLGAGTYSIKISSALTRASTTFTNTTLTTSAVPLPAALPLFGAALVGVGLLGRRRSKGTKAA